MHARLQQQPPPPQAPSQQQNQLDDDKEESTGSLRESKKYSTRRKSSKEDKKVNFSEEVTPAHTPTKELHKRDSQRDISGPRGSIGEEGSPKSSKKFVSTWKMACDKTKDRTKELLKRWRTMPDESPEAAESDRNPLHEISQNNVDRGWSVHVWGPSQEDESDGQSQAAWVKRDPSGEDSIEKEKFESHLTDTQKEKLSHFFSHVFDMDRDDIISMQDLESFTERLRHFADWSANCGEYLVLEQVRSGLMESFILPLKPETDAENATPVDLDRLFLSLEDWLLMWNGVLLGVRNINQLPLWLQYLPKVLFKAINRSGKNKIQKIFIYHFLGTGIITQEELGAFYSSVMGFTTTKVSELVEIAYKSMTGNKDFKLSYNIYRLCFANFLLGRFPNGHGTYIFGYTPKKIEHFPIDYSAMNTPPEDLEPYIHDIKSNRSSIIV